MFHVPVHTKPAADNGDSSTSQQSVVTLSKVTGSQWLPVGLDAKTHKAEALLVMQLASSNYSCSSYDNIAGVCRAAFGDSEIAQNLTMNRKKASYTLSYGLSPYFHKLFQCDLKSSAVPFYVIQGAAKKVIPCCILEIFKQPL